MISEDKTLLTLAAANVTQLTSDGKKQDWIIRENITGESLCRLPGLIPDGDMMRILEYIRKVELDAFNIGINFQKNKQNQLLQAQIDELKAINAFLKEENERMVGILESTLPSEV